MRIVYFCAISLEYSTVGEIRSKHYVCALVTCFDLQRNILPTILGNQNALEMC